MILKLLTNTNIIWWTNLFYTFNRQRGETGARGESGMMGPPGRPGATGMNVSKSVFLIVKLLTPTRKRNLKNKIWNNSQIS